MTADEERYLTADLHYDLESADLEDDMRKLFGRFVRTVLAAGLQSFSFKEPGRYGRRFGIFIFSGLCKGFSYTLEVRLKERKP